MYSVVSHLVPISYQRVVLATIAGEAKPQQGVADGYRITSDVGGLGCLYLCKYYSWKSACVDAFFSRLSSCASQSTCSEEPSIGRTRELCQTALSLRG